MIYPDYFIAAGYEYADIEHFIAAPFFRKKFTATKTARAEIVIGAAGFYKLFINGKDIKIGQKSGNLDSNIVSKGGKSHTDFYHKHGIGFF